MAPCHPRRSTPPSPFLGRLLRLLGRLVGLLGRLAGLLGRLVGLLGRLPALGGARALRPFRWRLRLGDLAMWLCLGRLGGGRSLRATVPLAGCLEVGAEDFM